MSGDENIFKWLDDRCGISIDIAHDELLEMAIILFCAARGPAEPEPKMPSRVIGWWTAKKTTIEAEVQDLSRKLDDAHKEWSGGENSVTPKRYAQLSWQMREYRRDLEAKQEISAKLHLDRCPSPAADAVPVDFANSAGCG